ncbi:MAG: metallophosphoesterase family protein [Thiolinea sp.]
MNLGALHEEVLIFGGNYSNLQATQAMQAVATHMNIPSQRVICTGDVVAYCAQPEETVQLMRDWGVPVVMGNCEESLGFDSDDCGCGFEEGTACAVLSDSWFNYSRLRVSTDSKAWMRELPRTIHFQLGDKRFQVVHGGVSSINRFLFASMPDDHFQTELKATEADVIIGGHAGIPFARNVDQQIWLNSGVIGMPANEGIRDTWYMLLQPTENGVQVRWEKLEYDADTANHEMHKRGLGNGYADGLLSGLWPSMDVLPEKEKQQCGKAIHLPPLTLSR